MTGRSSRPLGLSTLLRRWERVRGSGWARARCWVLRDRAASALRGGGCCGAFCRPCRLATWWSVVGCCSYFENYTVDASIFEMAFGLSLIDDLLDHEKTHVISSL